LLALIPYLTKGDFPRAELNRALLLLLEKFLFKKVHNKIMIEILSITFFSGMMSIFIIILLLMGALLLIGKNPFKGFSLTALVTTKPLAAKLSPYGKSTSWQYGLGTQKGGTTIKGGWREKQTGKPIGLIPKTIESVRTAQRYLDTKGNKERSSFFKNIIDNAPDKAKGLNNLKRSLEMNRIIEYLELRRSTGKKIEKYYTLKEKEKKGKLTEAEKRELEELNKFIQSLKNGVSLFAIEAHKKGESAEGLARIVKFNIQNGLGTNFTQKRKVIKLIEEHKDAVTLLLTGPVGLGIEKITRKHKDEVDVIPSYLAVLYKELYKEAHAKAIEQGKKLEDAAKDAKEEAEKAVKDVIEKYNENNKGLPKLELDKKGMKRIVEEAEKLDKYPSRSEDLEFKDLIKKSEGIEKYLSDLATAWGRKAEKDNTKEDDFARIIGFKQEYKIDLSEPFLTGIAIEAIAKAYEEKKDQEIIAKALAEGKSQEAANKIAEAAINKAAADTVNKAIYGYNQNFVGEMRGGSALPIQNTLKKETGIEVKFNLPFVEMDLKKIAEKANKAYKAEMQQPSQTNKAEMQQLNPENLKNVIELMGYSIIADAKDKGQSISFSPLVMAGGAHLTQQKTQKGA
jgi:hypothetical protein